MVWYFFAHCVDLEVIAMPSYVEFPLAVGSAVAWQHVYCSCICGCPSAIAGMLEKASWPLVTFAMQPLLSSCLNFFLMALAAVTGRLTCRHHVVSPREQTSFIYSLCNIFQLLPFHWLLLCYILGMFSYKANLNYFSTCAHTCLRTCVCVCVRACL